MYKLCLLFVFAILSHEALGMRMKRQSRDKGENIEDRYGWNRPGRFPNQQNPGQGTNPGQTTRPTPNRGSTTENPALQDCLRSCPVTPEHNPVCGSNDVTYGNPGRLLCAQSCGVNVIQVGVFRCPNASTPPNA